MQGATGEDEQQQVPHHAGDDPVEEANGEDEQQQVPHHAGDDAVNNAADPWADWSNMDVSD